MTLYEETTMEHRATIMGIADATHYLVGETDAKENFTALPKLGDVIICHSLFIMACSNPERLSKT